MVLKVGMIGAGSIVPPHLKAYAARPDVQVASLAALNVEGREQLAQQFSIPRTYDDYRAMLRDEEIELVDICVPHHLHHPMVIEALAAGKHVIVEKPIAITLAQADEMIEAAEKRGLKLFVSLNQRFIPEHRKAKDLLDEGAIGEPFYFLAQEYSNEFFRMNDPIHWKGTWDQGGGGALMDTGSHIIDLAHYWFGEAKSLTAVTRQLLAKQPNKGEDTAIVTLEFESGLLANIVVCYSMVGSPTEHKRKDFYGTGGNFWIDLDSLTGESLVLIHEDPAHKVQPTEENLYPVKHFLREIVAVEPRSEPDYRSDRGWWQSSVESCVNHFVDCIVKGERPLVSAIDARRSLRTVLAAYESSSKGRRIELA